MKDKVKFVVWEPLISFNKRVYGIDVMFYDANAYHHAISRPLEQHHPKLFMLDGSFYTLTKLGKSLHIAPPSDSYSLSCKSDKAKEFLDFWKNEGYEILYNEPDMDADIVEAFIKLSGIKEFTKKILGK